MIDLTRPVNLSSLEFVKNKFEWFERIREEKPVYMAKVSVLKIYTVSRYDDCTNILKDPRVLRNRSTVTGGSRFPIPLPKSIKVIAESMITEDDPNHRRLRELVRRAFRPQAVAALTEQIDLYSHELLDELERREHFDLQTDYALKIPVRMIGDMLGIARDDMPKFIGTFGVLTEGFSGWRLVRTLFKDMPQSIKFVRQLIRAKAKAPADDILSHLIQTEDNGDRLTEDELVAMVFLLIVAGYETTVHLISNGVLTLLQHPQQLEQLRAEPTLIDSAVEEILRHRGPVQSTKPGYAAEDISLHGVTIPKGKPIMPLFGAANHDPRVFVDPLTFDITRNQNRHLGFGHGNHFCLGAHLARAEARLGLLNLIQRLPNLRLAVDESALELQRLPGWHRYNGLPVATGRKR